MPLLMISVGAVVIVCVVAIVIAAALVIELRSRSNPATETARMDTIWIVIGLTIVAVVCCGGMAVVVFIFGVPILPMGWLVGSP
jgi:hypothetical protein